MLTILFAALTATFVLATALPISRCEKWWVRVLDFPRLQLTIAGVLILLALIGWSDLSAPSSRIMIAATAICIVYQGWWILPYTRPYPNEVRGCAGTVSEDRIRILTANVLSPNRNASALLAMIREHAPDIVVTLESNAWWQQQLDVLEEEYRFTIKCPLENLYGMHVYSRLPLEDSKTQFLVEPDIPSMHALAVLKSQQRIQLHFLHPAPPSPTENEESTQRDTELLIVAKQVSNLDMPVIVTGDLNDVGWSASTRLFRKISGLLDPRVGRGMFNTYHAKYWFMRWPLDHLFHSRHFTLSFMKRLPAFGSDHFPVLVELVYEQSAETRQEGLEADASDEAIAEEKMSKHPAEAPDVHAPSVSSIRLPS